MKILIPLLILVFSESLWAVTYKIFAAETPPLLEKRRDGVSGLSGIFGKIVAEKITKSGKTSEFEVTWAPWKRALSETLKSKNGLFFPLGRTPEREKDYVWLAHLGTLESWFYATNPEVKIKSLQDLKKYRIGYLNGSMRENELRKILGEDAKNMEGLTEDPGNYRKLISGRIDIWVTQIEVFENAQSDYRSYNAGVPKVYALKKFLDQEVWIVSGIGMSEKHQDQIRMIFKTSKRTSDQYRKINSETAVIGAMP